MATRTTPLPARLGRLFLMLALVGLETAAVLLTVIYGVRLADDLTEVYVWTGVGVGGALVLGVVLSRIGRRVPRRTVLELDLAELPPEAPPADPVSRFRQKALSLREVVETLERGGRDKRVAGLVARIAFRAGGLGTVQELRDAVRAFREQGKFAVAYTDTYGEGGPGNAVYYLATAFGEIHLQPSGDVGLTGVLLQANFLKGTLDKIGAKAEIDHRHEHKLAKNMLTETRLTKPHREQYEWLAGSLHGQYLTGIAEGRGVDQARARELIDGGPYLGEQALEAGLVDRLCYRDETLEHVKEQAGGGRLLRLDRYRKRTRRPRGGKTVAVICGVGAISRGRSRFDPLTRTTGMGSDTVTRAFRKAINDKRVKAILFRVDSPGGSYVASDSIWREVVRAREAGKPVVVSMANVAGSGGYFVAMPADRIVAHPATLTGSIGVVGGKQVVAGTKKKLGITTGEVHMGENATIFSASQSFTPEQWDKVHEFLDRIYDDFTQKVADGRKLDLQGLDTVARGRVWTGEQALEHGLVDELGGYPTALRLVREVTGLKPDARIALKEFPEKKPLLAQFRGGDDEDGTAIGGGPVEELVRPIVEAAVAYAEASAGALTMPYVPTIR